MNAALDAKVKAVNRANGEALKLHSVLVEIFRPLVGTKVEKADGTLLKKIADLLPELPYTSKLHVYKNVSNYFLAWNVKAVEGYGEHHCTSHEASVYVGFLANGAGFVLEKLADPPDLRTDYTAEEVLAKRADFDVKRKAADAAKCALGPFGEFDR